MLNPRYRTQYLGRQPEVLGGVDGEVLNPLQPIHDLRELEFIPNNEIRIIEQAYNQI